MVVSVPSSLSRLALEVEGWLDLHCPEQALAKVAPLLAVPGARSAGLYFRTRALVELGRCEEALACLTELRPFEQDPDWLDLTEAWCLKRVGNVTEAAACMERLLQRSRRSAVGHYNLGCYLALLGQRDRAIDEVSLACGMEAAFRRHLATETDLGSLRGDPRFDQLMQGGR